MILEFELRHAYGHQRFYPANSEAEAVVALTGRRCLRESELELLDRAGFYITVFGEGGETLMDTYKRDLNKRGL